MSEDAPEYSKHVDDATHPAGNEHLAEEMAYAGKDDKELANWYKNAHNTFSESTKLSEQVIGSDYEANQRMASNLEKRASEKEEQVRTEFTRAQPMPNLSENGQTGPSEKVDEEILEQAGVEEPPTEVLEPVTEKQNTNDDPLAIRAGEPSSRVADDNLAQTMAYVGKDKRDFAADIRKNLEVNPDPATNIPEVLAEKADTEADKLEEKVGEKYKENRRIREIVAEQLQLDERKRELQKELESLVSS